MDTLKYFLERFTRSLDKDTSAKAAVTETIFTHTHIKIDPGNVSLKDGILTLTLSPVMKSEVRLKEELIRNTLKSLYKLAIGRIIYK